jgi:periplasmic protein CpxP/Spy
MNIKKMSLLAALLAGAMMVAPASHAQEKKDAPKQEGREGRPGRPGGEEALKQRVERMSETLKLTDDQKTKLTAAFKAQADKMREIRGAGGTPEENREKMRGLREEADKKIKEILTAEQYAKWEKERPQGRPDGPGGPGGERKKKKTE